MTFETLSSRPVDPLLRLAAAARRDSRPDKLDLSIGVYRNDMGATPVLRAVKTAERRLADSQISKSYLGIEGDPLFLELLSQLILGPGFGLPLAAIQTIGGTGAVYQAALLLLESNADARIWLPTPTWVNHIPLFRQAGLEIMPFDCFDRDKQVIRSDAMMAALLSARKGDAVLLQPVCQNPTGADFSPDLWREIIDTMAAKGLVPLIDLAYHGFGEGLEADVAWVRAITAAIPNALIAYSCSKNFGLYRDRIGALLVRTETEKSRDLVLDTLIAHARAQYSMPADHGAAIVRLILSDPLLTSDWIAELDTMREKIEVTRLALVALGRVGGIDLSGVAGLHGMFATLPIAGARAELLREDHAIYIPASGRINLAGLAPRDVPRFANALAETAIAYSA